MAALLRTSSSSKKKGGVKFGASISGDECKPHIVQQTRSFNIVYDAQKQHFRTWRARYVVPPLGSPLSKMMPHLITTAENGKNNGAISLSQTFKRVLICFFCNRHFFGVRKAELIIFAATLMTSKFIPRGASARDAQAPWRYLDGRAVRVQRMLHGQETWGANSQEHQMPCR